MTGPEPRHCRHAKPRSTLVFLVVLLALLVPGRNSVGELQYRALTVNSTFAPLDNPLKGFMPYSDQEKHFPHSLEWFYVPMKDLMNGPASFTLPEGLEPRLAAIASRGHQAVFRVYLDYPSLPTGVPDFLVDGDLIMHPYSVYGGGMSPDYGNPQLMSAILALIAELGRVYGNDPRIGFITMGFLGFWGEWHTYPHNAWFADAATQRRVIEAMTAAFPRTRLLLRYPLHHLANLPTGYHDDSFSYETLATEDYHFLSIMEDAGETAAWQTQPIGGEVYPDLQAGLFDDDPPAEGEDFKACVNQTHVSWLLNYSLFADYDQWPVEKQQRAEAAARMLGYNLAVSQVGTDLNESELSVACTIVNLGIAPFYYDWPTSLILLDATGREVWAQATSWSLRSILPGSANAQEFNHLCNISALAPGYYRLALRVANPMPGGLPLRFANQEQESSGLLHLGNVHLPSAAPEEQTPALPPLYLLFER